MGAERLAAASSIPHVRSSSSSRSVFVRGLKMSSELIHLLLDKMMARLEPRNRQTNPPNRPTKCKTVFVDSQRRDAAGRTLTRSDKDSVLKIPKNGMQNLSNGLTRPFFGLLPPPLSLSLSLFSTMWHGSCNFVFIEHLF